MGAAQFALTPVGAGPFKVVAWKKDDRVELEAFAEYWGGAPKIKKLVFKPVPSESARAAALASGELDVVPILPPALVDSLGSRQGLTVKRVESNKVVYLGFDVNNPLLSDIRVRKAIDMAVDRNAISQRLLRGLGKPSGQVIAPVTFGYAADINPTAFDAKQAKELLAQTTYKGEKIVFQYPTNNLAFGQEVAQAIANYLGNIGVNVELQGMEYSAFFPLWANRKLNGIHLFAYGPSIMDADLILGSLYEKTGRLYWIDPQVQDLVQKQRAEADPAKRRAIIGEILKLSAQNLPYAPLYNEIHAYGIQNRVKWASAPGRAALFSIRGNSIVWQHPAIVESQAPKLGSRGPRSRARGVCRHLRNPRCCKMAGAQMSRLGALQKLRLLDGANRLGLETAGAERAARGRSQRIGQVPLEDDAAAAPGIVGIRVGNRRQQRLRVGMAGASNTCSRVPVSTILPRYMTATRRRCGAPPTGRGR